MGLLDKLRKRNKEENEEISYKKLTQEEIRTILDQEVINIFPKTGEWTSGCFSKGDYLQCHLRDNYWLAHWFQGKLERKDIYIKRNEILNYVKTSELFAKSRHEYELEIVRWQIDWMKNGGEGWLMPSGTDEFDLIFSPDVDKIFRAGIVKTLTAIGMDKEVVEEGIERNFEMWRGQYIHKAFYHTFEPISQYRRKTDLPPCLEGHKGNWIKLRQYEYYLEHKDSVDKYGSKNPNMDLTKEEVEELIEIVLKQSNERLKIIKEWKEIKDDYIEYKF